MCSNERILIRDGDSGRLVRGVKGERRVRLGAESLTSGLRLETRRTEWRAVGGMPWMAIRPATADAGMVRGPRAPGIACMERPERRTRPSQ